MAEHEIPLSPDGVPLGREEGDPEEHLTDTPEFLARFEADLVEIGRRFGLNQHVGRPAAARTEELATRDPAPASSSERP